MIRQSEVTHSDKETGVFPNLRVTAKFFRKNPVSDSPFVNPNLITSFWLGQIGLNILPYLP